MQRHPDTELAQSLCDIERGLTEDEVDFVEAMGHKVLDFHQPLTRPERTRGERILQMVSKRKVVDDD